MWSQTHIFFINNNISLFDISSHCNWYELFYSFYWIIIIQYQSKKSLSLYFLFRIIVVAFFILEYISNPRHIFIKRYEIFLYSNLYIVFHMFCRIYRFVVIMNSCISTSNR